MQFSGSITALATPFQASGAVDFDAFARILDAQVSGGTQAVVVAGSTGEASALDESEYSALVQAAVGRLGGRIPVLAGTGLSSTHGTIRRTRLAADAGADGALVVTPPYVRPTQDGLVRHYRAVAESGGLPVLLYNVPGRTGTDLLPDTVARLVGVDGIVGIKEARPEPERMQALLALRRPGFAVLSGDDPTACRALLAGADGLVSVASNAAPAAMRRLCGLARAGRADDAAQLDAALQPLFDLLGVEPNPIPVKALLALQGLCEDALRLPLLPLSDVHRVHAARIADTLADLARA